MGFCRRPVKWSGAFIFQMILACMPLIAVAEPMNIALDTEKSVITWTGKKLTGEHTGVVSLTSGTVKIDDGVLQGGEFEIDMSSIENKDLDDATYKAKLENHLKSDDFFAVKKFPKATFVVTSVEAKDSGAYALTGKLTIKDITHEITMDAQVDSKGQEFHGKAEVVFDRTKWGVKYNSGKFFSLTKLGDKLIYDEITVKLDLVTR